jgi:hypothetical protein
MDPTLLGPYAPSSSESSADESICALHLYNMATLAIYWVLFVRIISQWRDVTPAPRFYNVGAQRAMSSLVSVPQ